MQVSVARADSRGPLRPGEPGPDRRQVWIVARQHPGESMAEWFMEGAPRWQHGA